MAPEPFGPARTGSQVSTALGEEPWPESVGDSAMHGLAGEIVRAIDPHTEADPVALLSQLLVGFGNVVGRGPHFMVEADRHSTNLYLALVGETSKGRKGTSLGHVKRLVAPVDPAWAHSRVSSGLSSGEGIVWNVRDASESAAPAADRSGRRNGANSAPDPGVADKRLLVVESELASTLKIMSRAGNTLSPTLRQAWDSGELRTLSKNSPAIATDAHISLIGHVTRDELRRELTQTELGNGFANRFLWVCVRRSKSLPEGGRISEVDLAPLVRSLREATDFARGVGLLERDDGARAYWAEVYEHLSESRPGLLGSVTSRAEAQVMRLACIYALLDRSSRINRIHLEAALAFWTYCEASCRHIFGSGLGNKLADIVLRYLRAENGGTTRTNIGALFSRHANRGELDHALDLLARNGLATCHAETTRGRPAERWFACGGVDHAR